MRMLSSTHRECTNGQPKPGSRIFRRVRHLPRTLAAWEGLETSRPPSVCERSGIGLWGLSPPPPPLSSGNFLNTTATGGHGWYCKLAGLSRTLMRERRRRPLGTGMRDADITLQITQGTGADEQCVGCDVLAPKAPASTLSNKRNKPNNESEHNFRTIVLRPQAWGAQHKTTLVGNLWPETQAYANNSLRRLSCSARPCSFQ